MNDARLCKLGRLQPLAVKTKTSAERDRVVASGRRVTLMFDIDGGILHVPYTYKLSVR